MNPDPDRRAATRLGRAVRATTEGSFLQPPAAVEMMYDGAVRGNSFGARIDVTRPRE